MVIQEYTQLFERQRETITQYPHKVCAGPQELWLIWGLTLLAQESRQTSSSTKLTLLLILFLFLCILGEVQLQIPGEGHQLLQITSNTEFRGGDRHMGLPVCPSRLEFVRVGSSLSSWVLLYHCFISASHPATQLVYHDSIPITACTHSSFPQNFTIN